MPFNVLQPGTDENPSEHSPGLCPRPYLFNPASDQLETVLGLVVFLAQVLHSSKNLDEAGISILYRAIHILLDLARFRHVLHQGDEKISCFGFRKPQSILYPSPLGKSQLCVRSDCPFCLPDRSRSCGFSRHFLHFSLAVLVPCSLKL